MHLGSQPSSLGTKNKKRKEEMHSYPLESIVEPPLNISTKVPVILISDDLDSLSQYLIIHF